MESGICHVVLGYLQNITYSMKIYVQIIIFVTTWKRGDHFVGRHLRKLYTSTDVS